MKETAQLESQVQRLEERVRRLLRGKILTQYRSLLEFDRELGDPANTTSQRLRGRVRLTVHQLLRYLEKLGIDLVDFFVEVYDEERRGSVGRREPSTAEYLAVIEHLTRTGEAARELLERSAEPRDQRRQRR